MILTSPLSQLCFDGGCEYTGTLFENSWLRILLIRQVKNPEYIRIELELQTCPFDTETKDIDAATAMIQTLILHMQYTSRLVQAGFDSRIIENSCVWSLNKEFNGEVDEDTLELLLPPTVHE